MQIITLSEEGSLLKLQAKEKEEHCILCKLIINFRMDHVDNA